MFENMRQKRRKTQMKSELNQSVDHFKRAAALAAQGTSATVGPKYYAARDRVQPAAVKAKGAATSSWDSTIATLAPLISAATDTVKQSGKDSARMSKQTAKATKKSVKADKKAVQKSADRLEKRAAKAVDRSQKSGRGGTLTTLALVGAVLGAGAAFVLRKRKAAQWDEYDPSAPITSTTQVAGSDDATFEPSDSLGYSTTTTTTVGTTTAAGAVSAADPALSAETTDVTKADTTLIVDPALTTGDVADQTSSPQHTPTVARMASGHNKD